jgi:hypothetical protein
VLAQEGCKVRLIVIVNGAAFDEPLFEEMSRDPRLEVHYLAEANVAAAQRFGRSLVETPYFAFLDDDDEYLPNALHLRLRPMLEDERIDLVATNGFKCTSGKDVLLYKDMTVFREDPLMAVLTKGNWLASGGAAFRSEHVGVEYFDGKTRFYEWTLLAFRLALDGRRIVLIDTITFRLHDTPGSVSKSNAYKLARLSLTDEMLRFDMPGNILNAVKRLRTIALHELCAYHRLRGDFEKAWQYHFESLQGRYGKRFAPYGLLLLLKISWTRLPVAQRPLKVLLTGNSYFGVILKRQLVAHSCSVLSDNRTRSLLLPMLWAKPKIIYQISGPRVSEKLRLFCKLLGIKIVVHWLGSDVSDAIRLGLLSSMRGDSTLAHWADAPWLVDELRESGLNADLMPLFAIEDDLVLPFPSGRLTVLSYLPDQRFRFYGGDLLLSVASRFPDVHFLVVGGSGEGVNHPPNFEFLGWLKDLRPIYARVHALLRVTEHDGFSFMVGEALSHSRHVIWNHSCPYVLSASSQSEIEACLRRLEALNESGSLVPNNDGRRYIREVFSAARVSRRIYDGLRTVAANRAIETVDHRIRFKPLIRSQLTEKP